MLVLFLLVFIGSAFAAQECDYGWKYYKKYCYKHFINTFDRLNYTQAEFKCALLGGHLANVFDEDSLTFLGDLTRMNGDGWWSWADQPQLGIKFESGRWVYPHDNTPPFLKFCPTFGHDTVRYKCTLLTVDNVRYKNVTRAATAPCLKESNCSYPFSRHVCRVPARESQCKNAHTESRNGRCVCEKGYIDITETDVPERRKYREGEKCISKDPCRDAKDLTVNFIVDSSESIGSTNWKSLVEFLKSGANYLPKRTRVGFIKYSTNVTFAEFLAPGWSKKKFRDFVPSEYENGGTNTAEALDVARKMFKGDSNRNQVAVLITDGLPFVDGSPLEDVLEKTKNSAKKLRSDKVNLIVLGYGDSLYKDGHKYIQEWLEDPQEDYFGYDKLACDFKELHMSILMRKVCRRYVKD